MEEQDIIISPDTRKSNRVPPGQHLTVKWPVLHFGSAPRIDTSLWDLRLFGLVGTERKIIFKDFMVLPQVKVLSDIHCVTTWSKLDNLWEGVGSATIKTLVDIKPEARFVIVHAAGNFTTNLAVEDFFQPDVLLAVKHNGENLSIEHGGPVRLVVPRLYFWKSAKWVTGLEFTGKDRPGFWESAGYHNHGDPWTEERYS
jgi:DMSO/TMAO reductase YedYZ molybdopterin-dependent catalytic subunit